MSESNNPPVGFQAEITYKGLPYTEPLIDSGFLDISVSDACHVLSNIENRGIEPPYSKFIVTPNRFYQKYPLGEKGNSSILQVFRSSCPWLKIENIDEYTSLIENNKCTEYQYIRFTLLTLLAMRDLYVLCLQTLREQSNDRPIVQCLSLLEFVHRYNFAEVQGENILFGYVTPLLEHIQSCGGKNEKIPKAEDVFRNLRPLFRRQSPLFPLADVFPKFIERYGQKYKQYDLCVKTYTTKRNHMAFSGEGINVPWWAAEKCKEAVQLDYHLFCRSLDIPEDVRTILFKPDAVKLADNILNNLDKRLNKAIEQTKPVISTKTGLVTWAATTIIQAEYLCLFRDLMTHKQFRICPICKSVFQVEGRGVTRLYCSKHSRNQIDYFNRLRKTDK